MKFEVLPHINKISSSLTHVDLLARISAPLMTKKPERTSLNLAIALDQSGSMSSNGAFEQAKKATLELVARLHDEDRVAVVLYNGNARVVLPSCKARDAKGRLSEILAPEQASGSTALHQGWLIAAQQAAPHVNDYAVSRVLLLSDGQATDGQKDPAALKEEAYQLLDAGISTGTYGLGMYFNEVLMTEMAAGGPARFAQDAEELAPYFQADFSMLSQVAAPRASVHIQATDGQGKACSLEMLNDYTRLADGSWRLPAIIEGAESWAALRVSDLPGGDITIKAIWKWTDTQGQEHQHHEELVLPQGKGRVNKAVQSRCAEALGAKMARQAAQAARMGDLASAEHAMGMLRGLSASVQNAYLSNVTATLDHLLVQGNTGALAKEALYSSSAMSNRVADVGEDAALLNNDRFGLRKAVQGRHVADKKEGV